MKIGSPQWREILIAGARELGVVVDDNAAGRLAVHARELMLWNRKVNLTAITEPEEVALKHFVDALAAAPLLRSARTLLDMGSGGGFPGIPIKIVSPALAVTLIDASRKKVSFLKHVIRTLKLKDIEARHIRAEDLARETPYTGYYDGVICRAFASLEAFVRLAQPFMSPGGVLIAMKAKAAEAEIEAPGLSAPARTPEDQTLDERYAIRIRKYRLPYLGSERALISLKARIFP